MSRISSIFISIVILIISGNESKGQNPDKYLFSNKIFNLQFLYNYHVPSGDIAKTYGNFNSVGTGGMFKLKNNWIFTGEFNYVFGADILKPQLFDNLITSGTNGYISSIGGAPANYSVNMRGYTGFVKGGRLFAWNKNNMNSGIMINAGIGFIQHRINIQTQQIDIPQLDVNYKKGYDRLSSGVAFSEFIGYSYQSQNRLINFYLGLEFIQSRTINRRGYNYDERAFDTGVKKDFTTSFKFGWMIPIYLNTKEENEFQFR